MIIDKRRESDMTELTDEYIKKVVVSGNIEHNQTILLKPYDDKWPVLFEREKNRISKILKERALMIEHIGSTLCTWFDSKTYY